MFWYAIGCLLSAFLIFFVTYMEIKEYEVQKEDYIVEYSSVAIWILLTFLSFVGFIIILIFIIKETFESGFWEKQAFVIKFKKK